MKYTISLIALSLLFSGLVFAKAEGLPDSGITPDSHFYFLKTWKENIQTFFTFGAENKAKQYLHLADVRMAEYQKLIEKEKTDIAEKTLEKYKNQLQQALDKISEIKKSGKNETDLSTRFEQAITKHLQVLQVILLKVPEPAKLGIQNAINASQKVIEERDASTQDTSKLSGVLFGLTQSSNYEEFARKNGLQITSGSIKVYIYIQNITYNDYVMSDDIGVKQKGTDNIVQALVRVEKLLQLTEDPHVRLIEMPVRGVPL
ncbi:MAG: DUF5667 domain-containing protein [bacterium]|nr:DUF5667 domain-containing protein [bacterium]